jgi:hypothetical protein
MNIIYNKTTNETINILGNEISKKLVCWMSLNGKRVPDIFQTAMRIRMEINDKAGYEKINVNLIDIGQYSDAQIIKIFNDTMEQF